MRLKPTDKVIGYTLSLIRDGDTTLGAALFFKDLTRVEQLEERERLPYQQKASNMRCTSVLSIKFHLVSPS